MLSTLMVSDGIKVLSGGHSRCSEPRPLVALHGRRAVISVPHCQRVPPPLPQILSICRISGADGVQGMHFSAIHCCALAPAASANEGSSVRGFTCDNQHIISYCNFFSVCKNKIVVRCLDTSMIKSAFSYRIQLSVRK